MPNEYISTVKLPGDDTTYYIKDAEGRTLSATKITDPASKSNGQFLMFDSSNNAWVAHDVTIPQGVEYQSNKVTSINASSTDVQYPSAKCVWTVTENIREVAEGKTKSYVLNARTDITGTYDATTDSYTNVTAITGISDLSVLNVGDVLLIKAVDVADYWVSATTGASGICLNKLETTKIDLTLYVSKAEAGALAYKDSASATYTPAGTISTPTITVTEGSTTVNSITNVGTLPSWSASVNSEILEFSFSAGSLPTKGENTSVSTGVTAATSSTPTFSGTQATITAS